CPHETKELQVIEEHLINQKSIEHILPMLGLDKVMEKPDAIEIELKTKEIRNIKAISDTVASICATSDWVANKCNQLVYYVNEILDGQDLESSSDSKNNDDYHKNDDDQRNFNTTCNNSK
ncbi:hypothetical protein RFI_21694, partial [Reticulomyxa filosa]